MKNLLELKPAQRVLIENNKFENCWSHSQSGNAILFTVRNQDGSNPWAVVQDVTFRRNEIHHVEEGLRVLGADDTHISQQMKRVLVENNLWHHMTRSDGFPFFKFEG